jgi:signal transduction histidine kinase
MEGRPVDTGGGLVASRGPPDVATSRELAALLAVSKILANGGQLTTTLDGIAREAASVVAARSASIFLLRGRQMLRLAGSFGLSARYGSYLATAPRPIAPGQGPSGLAVTDGVPILIADTESDPRFASWRGVAAREGYRSIASFPLIANGRTLGALNVYRTDPGPWPAHELDLITFFAENAASAILTAELIERQHSEVTALTRVVAMLRHQTHEHANRLHAIGGLLALGEYQEAQGLIAGLQSAHHQSYGAIVSKVHEPTIAGLILAEMTIARQRGIALQLDRRASLRKLPSVLTEADAITILGNLVQNALDAVAGMPKARRKVSVYVRGDNGETTFRVRDWGPGLSSDVGAIFKRGFTTKNRHAGVGLALVADTVAAVGGRIRVSQPKQGTELLVTIPDA